MGKTLKENEIDDKTQVGRVLKKFGGLHLFADALKNIGRPRNIIGIRKWSYPKKKQGCSGVIPNAAWPDILAAARNEGIILTDKDFDPRRSK